MEDEPLVASLICEVLAGAGFDTASAADAAGARDVAESFDPDAALIDVNLGRGACGLQLGYVFHQVMPHVALIFLSKYYDPRLAVGKGGEVPPGSTFIAKDSIRDTGCLVQRIESALRPGNAVHWDDLGRESAISGLTVAQLETLRLAALSYTNAAIAEVRGVSERAVERRLAEVYEALGITASPVINQRVEAVKRYVQEAGMPTQNHPSPP